MIRPRLATSAEPVQIPLDRIPPLLQLPRLPLPSLPRHLGLPKHLRRLPTRGQFMPQPEVLKPFQHEQKTRPLPFCQAAEFRQIRPPTPACLANYRCAHGLHLVGSKSKVKPKMCSHEHFFSPSSGHPMIEFQFLMLFSVISSKACH
jgi:hypothetical protein